MSVNELLSQLLCLCYHLMTTYWSLLSESIPEQLILLISWILCDVMASLLVHLSID